MSLYDVFLSFRGDDTRNSFTDHLYMALTRAGFRTFRDSEELRTGKNISEALIEAIRGSRISVVVFSENYAYSSWCLKELVHILECRRDLQQKVLPIFYHVNPSDISLQRRSYGDAFEKHKARKRGTPDDISGWRSALTQAANLAGWILSYDGSEKDLLQEIVEEIIKLMRNYTYLREAVYPVGIESRIKDICTSLCDGKEDGILTEEYLERTQYDVLLNFRGEDTRNSFMGHLYMALTRAGVRTFRDFEGLRKGENISEELIKAIRGSRFSVVVFSENYAYSSWCLNELVHILECRRDLQQKVLPIFYRVNPSDVRRQKGSYGNAFEIHKARQTPDVISGWRSALTQAGDLSGWVSKDSSEAEIIETVVSEISIQLLHTTYLRGAVYPVGIESRTEDICRSLSDGEKEDVRMVGILGMGGSGKSSLAKAVYNKFSHTFENKSFLGNVRETAKKSSGKITLQEKLLNDILKPTKIEVGDADRGIVVIKERLGSKKVLVIVDNVDDIDQLTALAMTMRHDSFGPGSRIIITTRDRQLLKQLGVDKIHETREMEEKEALELFSWHAFHNPSPDSEFSKLTETVVKYCGGLPLALEVLGSRLYKGDITDWETTVNELKDIPPKKIQEILKISYDALEENQRKIFLHISCFFVGMNKNYVTHILHGCGLHPGAISVLLQRGLVTVNEQHQLMTHDLLRDMGREVVRAESDKEPGERSRLWRQEEVIDVLNDESGTNKIEGLALELQRPDEKGSAQKLQRPVKNSFRTKAFKNMKRLKLLQLNYVQLDGDYKYVSKQLRWLCWHGFSRSTIGNEFLDEQNLVSIDLRYSKLKQVWEQPKRLEKLKILNLSHSHYLTQTPDFSYLPELIYLILEDCKILSEIHESIGNLKSLVLVNLKDCIMVKDLPKSLYSLKSVKSLDFSGCSKLQDVSDDIGNMTSLTSLLVRGTAISRVPPCLGRLNLNNESRQDLTLVKQCFPEVPRSLPQGFTSLDTGSIHSLPEHPCSNTWTNAAPASEDLPTMSKELESDHCTALALVPNSSKASGQSTLQGWIANGEGSGSGFVIDSNPIRMFLNYCTSITFPNFPDASRQSILQGLTHLTAREDGVICLSGNDFPKPFIYIRKSDHVFFQVPDSIGCNLKALTVLVVWCNYCCQYMFSGRNSICITNHSKRICGVVRPAYPSTVITSHEVIWQGSVSNNQLMLEDGDFVLVEVVTGSGLRVKKTEVSLVRNSNFIIEDTMECELIPYENQAGPSHDSSDEDRKD